MRVSLVAVLLLCLSGMASAWANSARPWWQQKQGFTPSYNDFGGTGLLQTPNARMHPDGNINVGVSNVQPYRRYVINLQALPWLETGFRFTQVLNRIEPSSVFFGDEQNFFDRGVDVKIRLSKEMRFLPEIAFGVRDLGGTNLFGSEYLVFSRRYYNWDFTGGIAWGNLGSRGHLPNPFTIFGDSINSREGDNRAGSFNPRFFRGENIGLFGGIEYITPWENVRLKLEYDSNSYQQEPLNNPLETASPINAGIEYRPTNWLHLTAGIERGNNALLRATIAQSLTRKAEMPKFLDAAPEVVALPRPASRPALPLSPPEWQRPCSRVEQDAIALKMVRISGATYSVHLRTLCAPDSNWLARRLKEALEPYQPHVGSVALTAVAGGMAAGPAYLAWPLTTGFNARTVFAHFDAQYHKQVRETEALEQQSASKILKDLKGKGFPAEGVRYDGRTITVWLEQRTFRSQPKGLGRAARIIANRAPGDVEGIRLQVLRRGLTIADVTFRREDVENGGRLATTSGSPGETWYRATLEAPGTRPAGVPQVIPDGGVYPKTTFGISPAFRQSIGGPDKYYTFQIYAAANAEVQLTRGWSVGGSYGLDLYNNFDQLQLESASGLPKVRTDVKNYLQQGSSGIFSLDTHYLFNIRPNWYGKVSAGLFEPMFGGAGGEILYAPFEKRWAIGGEFYWVKQRDYAMDFNFRNYETTTGHATFYYKIPVYDMVGRIHAGRYLAGDDGATFEISRQFDSGVTAGVFATLTDVPFDRFGEGSFDKGFYLSIPLDMFLARSSQSRRGLSFRPVTRDGGARVDVSNRLYGIIDNATKPTLEKTWGEVYR